MTATCACGLAMTIVKFGWGSAVVCPCCGNPPHVAPDKWCPHAAKDATA